jgi:hypothetical protein
VEKLAEAREKLADEIRDRQDPQRKLERELARVDDLEKSGNLTPVEADQERRRQRRDFQNDQPSEKILQELRGTKEKESLQKYQTALDINVLGGKMTQDEANAAEGVFRNQMAMKDPLAAALNQSLTGLDAYNAKLKEVDDMVSLSKLRGNKDADAMGAQMKQSALDEYMKPILEEEAAARARSEEDAARKRESKQNSAESVKEQDPFYTFQKEMDKLGDLGKEGLLTPKQMAMGQASLEKDLWEKIKPSDVGGVNTDALERSMEGVSPKGNRFQEGGTSKQMAAVKAESGQNMAQAQLTRMDRMVAVLMEINKKLATGSQSVGYSNGW